MCITFKHPVFLCKSLTKTKNERFTKKNYPQVIPNFFLFVDNLFSKEGKLIPENLLTKGPNTRYTIKVCLCIDG